MLALHTERPCPTLDRLQRREHRIHATREVACPNCEGEGGIDMTCSNDPDEHWVKCSMCDGEGTIRLGTTYREPAPTLHRQRFLDEARRFGYVFGRETLLTDADGAWHVDTRISRADAARLLRQWQGKPANLPTPR